MRSIVWSWPVSLEHVIVIRYIVHSGRNYVRYFTPSDPMYMIWNYKSWFKNFLSLFTIFCGWTVDELTNFVSKQRLTKIVYLELPNLVTLAWPVLWDELVSVCYSKPRSYKRLGSIRTSRSDMMRSDENINLDQPTFFRAVLWRDWPLVSRVFET